MEDMHAWAVGILMSIFNLIAQTEAKLGALVYQFEQLNITASEIAERLETARMATLAIERQQKNKDQKGTT